MDRHETDYVSKESAVSSPKAELPVAFKTLGIDLRNFRLENSDQYSDSETVQQLFQLVWYSRDIRPKYFGPKLRGKKSIKAERSYDLHLKTRAADLANDCSQTKMCDRSEIDWKLLLLEQVFRSFNQTADDRGYNHRRAHHW